MSDQQGTITSKSSLGNSMSSWKNLLTLIRYGNSSNIVRNAVNLFLSGLFDLEGSVSQEGYIVIYNVSYELLIYVQELLKRFGIETTEPSSNVDLCNNPCYIYLSCFPLFGSFCFSSPCLLAGLEATRTSIALSGSRSRGSERNWETTRGGEEYPYPPPLVPWSFVHSYL
jgi:hypothetical protein